MDPVKTRGPCFVLSRPRAPNISTNTHDPPLFGTGNYNDPPPPFYLPASYRLIQN
jgi:hypothetical protein